MLASTMQHSTHNHTPTPPTTTTPTSRALDGPGQEQPEKTPTGVFSGPNSVPNPPDHSRKIHESIVMFHPATPQHSGAWNQGKGEPELTAPPTTRAGRHSSWSTSPHG